MQSYWLTFTDGTKACCEGESLSGAKVIAEHFTEKTVAGGMYENIEGKVLPYPATPIIWQFDHPVHGITPAFCHSPNKCAGNTCCRQRPSCTS